MLGGSAAAVGAGEVKVPLHMVPALAGYLYEQEHGPEAGLLRHPSQSTPEGGGTVLACCGRNWPRLFLLWSAVSTVLAVLIFLSGVLTAVFSPLEFTLNTYVLIFSVFTLSAELRQFKLLRGLIYNWIWYVYFLTTYSGRGLVYIFVASLIFKPAPLELACSVICAGLGVTMFVVNLIVPLPIYVDPRMVSESLRQNTQGESSLLGDGLGSVAAEAVAVNGDDIYTDPTVAPPAAGVYGYAAQSGAILGSYVPPAPSEGPNAL